MKGDVHEMKTEQSALLGSNYQTAIILPCNAELGKACYTLTKGLKDVPQIKAP